MARNLAYWDHAPEIPKEIAQINQYLRSSDLDAGLQHIVLLRVSQINKCAYCVELHSRQALEDGEDITRLNCLCVWNECDLFSNSEKAALGWAEALTVLEGDENLDNAYVEVAKHFDERGIADLTFLIATMNAWNRMGVGLGRRPPNKK
jgi:AhpD family alkylhydroperoxidase